ncbi:DBF4-type zinc finger-containing protein 2 isoform X2 [Manis pentadactyla]|uniref:DBF4-type zinc finger-containing protein 2 isoform X2 n=1 Tax=Manis pentadactyla TaxID=143292 RepID=UPI00255CDC66|nr:DBF4-type zinc finger-containing protein 2 isoform X2 [Manis pentadactyla]
MNKTKSLYSRSLHYSAHMSSAQHRHLTSQSRQRMCTSSLMERFLQDVLRHHPYHCLESRSMQHERLLRNTASPLEVVPTDDYFPEETTEDATGVRGERSTKGFEPTKELYSRPSKSLECKQDVSIRPSVIQKLEKGQQQPLEFVHKIGSGMKEVNPVGIGQATNRQNLVYPSVISNAPASCLPERSSDRPVATKTTVLPPAAPLESVIKCDPNKVDRYLEQQDRDSRNPMLPSHPETSSVPYQKPKESNRKSLCIKSDKLIMQDDRKSWANKPLSTGFKSREYMGTEGSLKFESLSKLAENPAINLNKTDLPSNRGICEGTIPKHHEKFFPNVDRTQEEKHLGFNKSAFLEQKSSVSSEMKFACGSLQSVSCQPEEAVQDLWKEEQIDQEDKNYESRYSEVSFDCSSSFHSLTDQSKVIAKEINLSKEVHADLQHRNIKSCLSEISSHHDGSLHLATNRTRVIVKDVSVQKAKPISLVDESYESSDSEVNFGCDASPQSTDDYPQQPVKEVNVPKEVHVGLVDKNYGSSSSEISVDSVFPLQPVVERLPVVVKATKLQKVHVGLVDKSYGSSCSETSFDYDVSLQSVVGHSQLAARDRNLKDRHVYLKDKKHKPSCDKAYHHCDCVSPETVTDEPQGAVEEINLLKEKNDCESQGTEMSFHTDAQIAADPQEIATDLENKSVKSSISCLSFESHASLSQSANDQSQGSLGDINLKKVNVDMDVKSYGCSSSELTFDSDPPLLSVTEHSELNVGEIRKEHFNLENVSCESNCSEITFDSDIPLRSLGGQSQEAVYGEEPLDLETKSNASCVSEITFDSDIPLHSGTDQPEVAVKEIITPKEEYVQLRRKNDQRGGSEISFDSYAHPYSVTAPPEVAVKKIKLQEEEQVHLESKENEPSVSGLGLGYKVFQSMTGHSQDLRINLQKEEHIHLEHKGSEPSVSDTSLQSDISLHLRAHHPDIPASEISHQKEHVNLEDKGNELSVSQTSLNSNIPLQSVIHKPEVSVKEKWLQKEKHVKFKGERAEFSGSEKDLDSAAPHYSVTDPQIAASVASHFSVTGPQIAASAVPHYSVTEPQIAAKEINVQKEEYDILEKKNDNCGPTVIFDSGVPPQSMTEKPQIVVLKEDHVDPESENTESRSFDTNSGIDAPLHSAVDQSQLALLKERNIDLETTNTTSSNYKVSFGSFDPLQPLSEQFQEEAKKTGLQKGEDIGLESKADEPSGSKLIHGSGVSLQPVADQPDIAVKQINLENEGQVYLEDKNSQYSGSEMSLDSDFLVQSIVDQPQITILEQEHMELEDKDSQSGGSEMSFDSDDPLQSVADQLRETVQEISLWKDEVDVEDKRDESKGLEITYDSDVLFQSVAGQTAEVGKEVNLWKGHVDLEGKIVAPGDSKINFDSNQPLSSVANEIQQAITEINLLREGQVCLDDKGYEPNGSQIIYVSNVPLQSVVEQPHILEEEHTNLEEKSSDLCGSGMSFASGGPLQPVADQLQKTVKEIGLWKEDHIYLEDKTYKLGDFEVSCDSDTPVHFVAGQSSVAIKEIHLEKKDQNDLENETCEPGVSEIKCGSCVHLQVDQPQVVCKEIHLPKKQHLGMEEKTSEPSDSEMCDSDIPLQIVVNEGDVTVKEANLEKMLYVDLVTPDSDCEMIADSDMAFQQVIDSPQMTVKEISCINTESFNLEGASYGSCGAELGYICEATPQSVTNPSKDTFKVVNQKKDYIILEESSCEPYGSEISFQIDPSYQSVTYQSQEPEEETAKYFHPEDASCASSSSKRNLEWKDTPQPVTHRPQKADKKVYSRKDGKKKKNLKGKKCESSVSAMDCNAAPKSTIHQVADKENLLKLKRTDIESMSCEPSGSEMNFQRDSSLPSDSDRTQETINKTELSKMSSDLKETNRVSHSSSIPMVDSVRNPEKAKDVVEDNSDEPVLEALPHVPPSFVGKTWSQIMREDDMKINALVKEFKEGRFHCYFDDDCETKKVKKKNSNEGKKITWADLSQGIASIQIFSDCDDNGGGNSDTDDFSVALDKPTHHPIANKPYEQNLQVTSRCQAAKVSHGTQTNLMDNLGKKRRRGEEADLPTRKQSPAQKDKQTKRRVKIGTLEFPESCTTVLKPLQPNALVYVLSSNMKLKIGEPFNLSHIKHRHGKNSRDVTVQYKYKRSPLNYYDPVSNQIVSNPPVNREVPESDRDNLVQNDFSDLNSSAEDNAHVQSPASETLMTWSVRDELTGNQGASVCSELLGKSETLNSGEVPKENSTQSTLVDHDTAQTSSKSVRNKILERKKKIQRKKMTANNKLDFPKKASRQIIVQQKTRIASKKKSIWIHTKLNDIIRKYIPKYSVFLRHKYHHSRSTFVRMQFRKKKPRVSKIKEAKKPAQKLSDSSVPSADAEEPLNTIADSSPKQLAQDSSSVEERKTNGNNERRRKKKRKHFKPVKIYALRSLSAQIPYSDRMRTRVPKKS